MKVRVYRPANNYSILTVQENGRTIDFARKMLLIQPGEEKENRPSD
jgi:hypothetical protein